MEPRTITIIDSRSQAQYIIPASTAITLGELIVEMGRLGIKTTDTSFFEGKSRTELKDEASILPTNIPWKGEITNDLVFMLTTPNKKIQSGFMSRSELITQAKKLGFPTNPTQAKTLVLLEFINKKSNKGNEASIETNSSCLEKCEEGPSEGECLGHHKNVRDAIILLTKSLVERGSITKDAGMKVLRILGDLSEVKEVNKEDMIGTSEISEMFSFL